jgi:hypothetical protein
MHTNLLCACWHVEAMKGSSSLTSCCLLILSRLPSSLVWAQLTLLVPALGIRSPPSPKWRPHSQGPRTLPYRDPEQFPQAPAEIQIGAVGYGADSK